MIVNGMSYLTAYQRKRLKAIHNGSQFGMYIHNFYINPQYTGAIIVNNELPSEIKIKDDMGNTFTRLVDNSLIGNWEIECNTDTIKLEVR